MKKAIVENNVQRIYRRIVFIISMILASFFTISLIGLFIQEIQGQGAYYTKASMILAVLFMLVFFIILVLLAIDKFGIKTPFVVTIFATVPSVVFGILNLVASLNTIKIWGFSVLILSTAITSSIIILLSAACFYCALSWFLENSVKKIQAGKKGRRK